MLTYCTGTLYKLWGKKEGQMKNKDKIDLVFGFLRQLPSLRRGSTAETCCPQLSKAHIEDAGIAMDHQPLFSAKKLGFFTYQPSLLKLFRHHGFVAFVSQLNGVFKPFICHHQWQFGCGCSADSFQPHGVKDIIHATCVCVCVCATECTII